MSKEENIKAILESHFAICKDEIINSALESIMKVPEDAKKEDKDLESILIKTPYGTFQCGFFYKPQQIVIFSFVTLEAFNHAGFEILKLQMDTKEANTFIFPKFETEKCEGENKL